MYAWQYKNTKKNYRRISKTTTLFILQITEYRLKKLANVSLNQIQFTRCATSYRKTVCKVQVFQFLSLSQSIDMKIV